MRTLASCTVFMALACVLPAQFQDRAKLQSDLERDREEKLKSAAREDRLQEIFYRHALGLPVDVTQFFAMAKAEEARPKAQAEEELRRIQKDAKGLVKEYEALRLRMLVSSRSAILPTPLKPIKVAVPPPMMLPVAPLASTMPPELDKTFTVGASSWPRPMFPEMVRSISPAARRTPVDVMSSVVPLARTSDMFDTTVP